MFFQLFLFYFRQMRKSYLYIGAMVFMIAMLVFQWISKKTETYDYMNYGSFVMLTPIVQAVMLLFMVYFYKLFSDELKYGANHSFISSSRVTLLKISALFLNHLLFLIPFIGIQALIIFMYFNSSGIPFSSFYTQTASFLVVYWYLPFVLAFFLGILTSLLFGKHKMGFLFMIVVWIGLGPINTEIFTKYFQSIPFSSIQNLFYIGTKNLSHIYDELTGYDLSLSSYIKILFWMMLAISFIFIYLLRFTRTDGQKGRLLSVVFVFLLSNFILFPKIFAEGKLSFSFGDATAESLYYKNLQNVVDSSQLQYTITKSDIHIEAKKSVSATVKVTLSDIQCNSPTFVLYHFFDVKKVTNKLGQSLPFKKQGDFVSVERKSQDPSDELTFFYEMKDSAKLPVSQNYLYLPNYFSWIPTKGEQAPLKFNSIYGDSTITSSMQTKEPIQYSLSFNGDMPFYTNLSSNGNGTYKGEVAGGISAIGGMIIKKQFANWEVVYPNSWSDISDDWPIFEDVLTKVHNEITSMFDIKDLELPRKILFLPPTMATGNSSYLSSDHLLFQNTPGYNISSSVQDIPSIYLNSLLWNYDKRTFSSHDQIEAFNGMLACFVRNEVGIKSPIYFLNKARPGDLPVFFTSNQETQNLMKEFYDGFYALPPEQQKAFLVLWYKEMHNVSDSWAKANKLLQDFKESVK